MWTIFLRILISLVILALQALVGYLGMQHGAKAERKKWLDWLHERRQSVDAPAFSGPVPQ